MMNASKERVLIVILLDISASMMNAFDESTSRLYKSINWIDSFLRKLSLRSVHNGSISPKYLISLFCYNYKILDVTNGFVSISENDQWKGDLYRLKCDYYADIKLAVNHLFDFLRNQMQQIDWSSCIVCNITDGFPSNANANELKGKIDQLPKGDKSISIMNILVRSGETNYFQDEYNLLWVEHNALYRNNDANLSSLLDFSSEIPDFSKLDYFEREFPKKKLVFGIHELDYVMEFIP